jgi:GT2 family glycosyltransferase
VSIIVCFYNAVEITIRCIDSIRRHTPAGSYELILVDDCSDDPDAKLLVEIAGFRLIRSEHNQGFTRSANLGAAKAAGDFLVFLNNDTRVAAGWLDELLDAVQSAPEVGAAGAMLVGADGVLQEAGGVIWSDGTVLNYGKGGHPCRSAYRFRREVDYCSGACMLLERRVFESVGGFDEGFAPGFYEDTDLCMKLWAAGYIILYVPESRVVHLGGVTFGSDARPGLSARFDKFGGDVNRFIFEAKWAVDLLHHYPPMTAQGMRGGRVPDRPRVLVCNVDLLAAPDQTSVAPRTVWILKLLHEIGCEVTLFPGDGVEVHPYADQLRRAGIEVHGDGEDLATMAEEREGLYDLVLLGRPSATAEVRSVLRRHFPRALLVVDAADFDSVDQQSEMGRPPVGTDSEQRENAVRRARRREFDEIRAADVISAPTEEEALALRVIAPRSEVVVLLPRVYSNGGSEIAAVKERLTALLNGTGRGRVMVPRTWGRLNPEVDHQQTTEIG